MKPHLQKNPDFMRNTISKPFIKGMCYFLFMGTIVLSSCGSDDEAAPAPTAVFEYEAKNKEVTFTNKSTNAKSYEWDFGDGQTSTDQAPVHTYKEYGTFTVRLRVTGDGGTATSLPDELKLAKSSPVVVDGTFNEWTNIAPAASSVSGDGGSLSVIKVDYDATNIYFYVKGNLNQLTRVYLNSDNNITTGATSPGFDYLWKDLGADYFFETDHATGSQLFSDDPALEGWGWVETIAWANGANFLKSSEVKATGSEKAVEFSILRASVPGISSIAISFGMVDINTTTWADAGALPVRTQGDGDNKVFGETIKMDLTK